MGHNPVWLILFIGFFFSSKAAKGGAQNLFSFIKFCLVTWNYGLYFTKYNKANYYMNMRTSMHMVLGYYDTNDNKLS